MMARAVVDQEQAEAEAEAEAIRQEMIKDLKEAIRLDKYRMVQQVLLDDQEAAMRKVQLEATIQIINDHKNAFLKYIIDVEDEKNWIRYMTCDGLPNPGNLSEMNTFIFLWIMQEEEINIHNIAMKYDIIINLLMKLDEIIQFSWMRPPDYIDECKKIKQQFRDKLQQWIDMVCYLLLREIEKDMIRESTKTARYGKVAEQLICCIWALIKWPIGIRLLGEKEPPPVEVYFEELELSIKMPADINCYCMAIRGLWLKYNHYSDLAASYNIPKLSEEYENVFTMDMLSFCQNEYNIKVKIREEQVEGRRLRLEEKKAKLDRLERPSVSIIPPKPEKKKKRQRISVQVIHPEEEAPPLPYLPMPEEIILEKENNMRMKITKLLSIQHEKTKVNLRKYKILGGVWHIDLVYHPPQPKTILRTDITLTTLQIPKKLKYVPFAKAYEPPPPLPPDVDRTPEVIEEELKALEAAMERLCLITVKLPSFVVWFEPPLVAHWIPERRIWSTEDVHDVNYNEEKQTITFRTGRLGIHGFAAFKFVNIPFQSWELKPEAGKNAGGGIVLNISAAIVQAEFIVREDEICLHSLSGGTSTALEEIIGEYMKLHSLIEKMRDAGCDLFPNRDAYCYVKALPVKHPITEKHLRECMAQLCTAYAFSWSRWNASRSFREIVIQFKELHGCVAKERTNLILLVTPMKTMVVSCTEVSSEFSDAPLEKEKFYADLYHLALQNAGIKSRLLMKKISFKLTNTIAELLGCTNVINMS